MEVIIIMWFLIEYLENSWSRREARPQFLPWQPLSTNLNSTRPLAIPSVSLSILWNSHNYFETGENQLHEIFQAKDDATRPQKDWGGNAAHERLACL